MTIAWAPRASASTAGEIALAVGAASPDGTSYFTTSHTTSREVSFDAPAGELVLTTTALNARGEEIDGDKRRITVPAFDGSRLAIGSPMLLRARTARDVRAFSEGIGAHPEVGREFDRADRLFIRFPVYGGPEIAVAARLLNRQGTEMLALPVAAVGEGLYQLEVPLGSIARGEYFIALEAVRGAEPVRVLVPIRVR